MFVQIVEIFILVFKYKMNSGENDGFNCKYDDLIYQFGIKLLFYVCKIDVIGYCIIKYSIYLNLL